MLKSTRECGAMAPRVLMITNKGPWPLLSTHEPLKATSSTHDHSAMTQTALMSADKHL